jgi:feruloyl esterase
MLGPGGFRVKTPAFCRVAGIITPSSDSQIHFEVWMPETGWNGKFRGTGNGGFAGSINYSEMAAALRDGYATASTDTGHHADGIDAAWALGHPEKITDFGYRAIHEMTVEAKSVVQAFYGDAPKHSYFASCSNGGRQALMEAQRFPEDYDGILAGAPAIFSIRGSRCWKITPTTFQRKRFQPLRKRFSPLATRPTASKMAS